MNTHTHNVIEKDSYTSSRTGVFLILTLLIGIGLRLYRLGYQSLWHDEILTFLSSTGTLAHVLFQTEVHTNVLPLYYLVVHAFLYLSEGDTILRIPSLIFGCLTIPLFFLVVREILGVKISILASFFLAVSPFHVFYSQEARPYALFLFLCILALFLLQQCLKKQGEATWLRATFVVVAASTFYCHTTAIPFLIFLGIYPILVGSKITLKTWWPSLLGLGLLLIPALYRAMMIQVEGGRQARSFEFVYFPYIIWTFFTGFSLGPSVHELHLADRENYVFQHLPIIIPVLVVLLGLGFFSARALWRNNRNQFFTLVLFFLFPLIFMSLASILTSRPFNVRHICPSFLPFLIGLAYGVQNLHKNSFRIMSGVFIIIVFIFSLKNYYFEEGYHRENSRDAGKFLLTHGQDKDLVICIAPFVKDELQYYTSKEKDFYFLGYPSQKGKGVDVSNLAENLQKMIGERAHFWVFYSRTYFPDPNGYFRSYLKKKYASSLSFHSNGVDLILYSSSSKS